MEQGDGGRATRERKHLKGGARAVEPVKDIVLNDKLARAGRAGDGGGRRGGWRRRRRRACGAGAFLGTREQYDGQQGTSRESERHTPVYRESGYSARKHAPHHVRPSGRTI